MLSHFSGEIKQCVDDGEVIVNFVDGKKQGLTRFINNNGIILSEVPYENNEIHGKLKQYYQSGSLLAIIEYEQGIPSGKFVSFYENGMKRLETYYRNGEFDGEFITFDEYGDKTSESLYRNGLKFGKSVSYYPKSQGGGMFEISNYNEKGLLTGDCVLLYPTGEIMAVTPYLNGKAQAYTKNYTKSRAEIYT
ncbi:MAG: hypothetical protein LBU35_02505 [Holosporales bacterium]|jgi:antitoxin component YwqK of YwqJK toxin-antitoxin module|nr:hypothetical protein [Holosporales bacterium]